MELVKRYSNVSDLVFLNYVDHFCLKPFSLFSAEGLMGRGQLRVQERHYPAHKTASLLHKHTAKNKIQETTLRKFCYYDNCKTRLSMTKYPALRNGSDLIL